jgi:hypothetical protein
VNLNFTAGAKIDIVTLDKGCHGCCVGISEDSLGVIDGGSEGLYPLAQIDSFFVQAIAS